MFPRFGKFICCWSVWAHVRRKLYDLLMAHKSPVATQALERIADSFADLPYVNEIIELGGISIGVVPPLTECVAIAHEGKNTLAMLLRRKGETLAQLLTRLDLAIARARTEDVFTESEVGR